METKIIFETNPLCNTEMVRESFEELHQVFCSNVKPQNFKFFQNTKIRWITLDKCTFLTVCPIENILWTRTQNDFRGGLR